MNDSILIAAQLGCGSLYHYQDFDPSSSRDADRLVDILRNHRIYCSNPANFNDPWDCKPYFDPAFLEDPDTRAATAEALISTRKGGSELNCVDEQLRNDPGCLKAMLHQFSIEMFTFIGFRWGVYCLSPDPCITLMWSHYSSNHKGICLEFSLDNSKFCLAKKVRYQAEYPPFLLHEPMSYMNMLEIKSDVWAYEQEFRLIGSRVMVESPLKLDGNYLSIGTNDLRSIILGCQASDETINAIKALLKEYAPGVAVRYAKRAPNKYRLVIED